ncbi:MAG: esterase [Bacteroidetes bacterium]|nr:esterase [Bacteroidota bacterium]
MRIENEPGICMETTVLNSSFLQREVIVDFYLPKNVADPSQMSLLLINDGQNMEELGLEVMLDKLYSQNRISPLFCAAIHANEDRKMEYGIANHPDYLGRGAKAGLFTSFVLQELLPYIHSTYHVLSFREKAFAGFSLGGLMALDIAWNHSNEFCKAGIFSGSFWWRDIDQDDPAYSDDQNRIMQQVIRHGEFHPGLQFFFQCGNMDETMDRNNNGIIDSIDDTIDLINELKRKGYTENDILYMEMSDGKHDIATWARAMPAFLRWGWGK